MPNKKKELNQLKNNQCFRLHVEKEKHINNGNSVAIILNCLIIGYNVIT